MAPINPAWGPGVPEFTPPAPQTPATQPVVPATPAVAPTVPGVTPPVAPQPAPSTPPAPQNTPSTPSTASTSTTSPLTPPNPLIPSTGDPSTDAILGQLATSNQEGAMAYANMVNQVTQLQNGPLIMTPEQQTYVTSMQSSLQSTIGIMKQAADASTAVTREALARSGATQSSPQTAASEIALSVQAGANQIQQASANATMQIAQFEMNIRSGEISAAQANYSMYEKYQEDQSTAFQQMYSDINEHAEFAANYGLAVSKYNLDAATFAENNFGLTPTQVLEGKSPNVASPVQNSQVSLGSGINSISYLDTSSPSFASLPAGEQRILIQSAKAKGVNVIDSSTETGKTFTTSMNALSSLQQELSSGTINPNEPAFQAEKLPSKKIPSITGSPFASQAKAGDNISTQLGLNTPLSLSPDATVQEVVTALQTQMATASGMTLPEFIQSQQVGTANNWLNSNIGNATPQDSNVASASWTQ